jgi:hypothetical protein
MITVTAQILGYYYLERVGCWLAAACQLFTSQLAIYLWPRAKPAESQAVPSLCVVSGSTRTWTAPRARQYLETRVVASFTSCDEYTTSWLA